MTKEVGGASEPHELRKILQEAELSRRDNRTGVRILRDEYAQVTINLWPQMIPRESVDATLLLQFVRDEFGATLDTSSLMKSIPDEARASITMPTVLSHALRAENAVIGFRGGFLTIPESRRVTRIRNLAIAQQTLSASVTGTSEEAEYCLRQLAILVNRAAGIERVWADIEPHIELISYSTSTVVDLGMGLKMLLSAPVRRFLDEEMTAEDGLGARMGATPTFTGGKFNVIPALERINFKFELVDLVSGRSESCDLEIVTHTTSDQNRSRVKVLTELKTDEHMLLLEKLIAAMSQS